MTLEATQLGNQQEDQAVRSPVSSAVVPCVTSHQCVPLPAPRQDGLLEPDTQRNVGLEWGFSPGQRNCIFLSIQKDPPGPEGSGSDIDIPYLRLCWCDTQRHWQENNQVHWCDCHDKWLGSTLQLDWGITWKDVIRVAKRKESTPGSQPSGLFQLKIALAS